MSESLHEHETHEYAESLPALHLSEVMENDGILVRMGDPAHGNRPTGRVYLLRVISPMQTRGAGYWPPTVRISRSEIEASGRFARPTAVGEYLLKGSRIPVSSGDAQAPRYISVEWLLLPWSRLALAREDAESPDPEEAVSGMVCELYKFSGDSPYLEPFYSDN